MLDVDHFKTTNDIFGHAAGDLLARYGGEEFVALLPATDVAQAGIVAERIRECVAGLEMPMEKGTVRVTVSIGVAAVCLTDESVDAVMNRADQALYTAKAERNRVVVHASGAKPQ